MARGPVALLGLASVLVPGCSDAGDAGEAVDEQQHAVSAPLPAAYCQVEVTGQGTLDLEADYLPHVIQCENGGANLEALKAQAIAARSVAYYNMATDGRICDSQSCQVYSCGRTPTDIHYRAVSETSGVYLSYADTLTYGFYVAGDSSVSAPSCIGASGSTEHWVTYNQGRSGTDVEQTALGYVGPPGFGQNRGCMSQWSARCLENSLGYDYRRILQFFYGEDIQLLQATGPCIDPVEPPPAELDAALAGQGSSAVEVPPAGSGYRVCAGDPVDFWFELENVGVVSWTDLDAAVVGGSVRLGAISDAPDPLLGLTRVSLNDSSNPTVEAGGAACTDPGCGRVRFSLSGNVGAEPGAYVSRWQLVDEGRGWFGPELSMNFRVDSCEGSSGGSGGSPGVGGTGGAAGAASAAGGPGASPRTRVVEGSSCSLARPAQRGGGAGFALVLVAGYGALRRRQRTRMLQRTQ